MWDILIAAGVVAPLVLGGVWLLLRGAARDAAAAARALVARVPCPRCSARPLEWRGVEWAVDTQYEDRDESAHGLVLHCRRCGGEFRYTDAGELHRAAGPGPPPP